MKALDCEAVVLPCDVANAIGGEAAAAKTGKHFGRIDVQINSAVASTFSLI